MRTSLEHLSAEASDRAGLFCREPSQISTKASLPAGGLDEKCALVHTVMIVVAYLARVCLAGAWYRRRLSNLGCSRRGSLQVNLIIIKDVKAATDSVREFLV
jgi:hypothetical protein